MLKIELKYIISIIISTLIAVFIITNILIINLSEEQSDYTAKNGILDLTDWKAYQSEIIELNGIWEFYPGVLIDVTNNEKDSSEFEQYEEIKKYVDFPGKWNSYLNEEQSSEGSGTYRLVIKVPNEESFGIKTSTIRAAARIFSNGREIIHLGKPALSLENFIPFSQYKIGVCGSEENEIQLVIQVSNYKYRSGGVLKPIRFGTLESIMVQNNKERAVDTFLVSVCLIIGLLFLFLYFQRRKHVYLKYFSITSFFLGFYISTMNEQILNLVLDYDLFLRLRIQFFLMIGFLVYFLKFVKDFLSEYCNHKFMSKLIFVIQLMFITVLNDPRKEISISVGAQQTIITLSMLISITYILWIFMKAIYKKLHSLEYFLVITTALLSYWIIVSLKILFEMNNGHIPQILIIMIMITTALLINDRLHLDYKKANKLSQKLMLYDRIRDEVFAKTSRELKEPLQIINNVTRTLLEGKKGSLNFRQQEDLLFVNQESQRISRLVDNLLDVSQIEKGKIELNLESVEPYAIVENLVEEMSRLIPEDKSLKLNNHIFEDFPPIKADFKRFTQIIYNLLRNAVRYAEKGEVTISAGIKEGEARFKFINTGVDLFKSVQEESDCNQVEESFELDFLIIKQLIQSHGGSTFVEYPNEKTSVFIFTLPLFTYEYEEEKEKEDEEEDIRNLKEQGVNVVVKQAPFNKDRASTILIVDSDEANQKNLSHIIHQMGLDVLLINKGQDALAILEREKVDLIILDFILEDMSGIQLCAEIRKKYSMLELPIIILSTTRGITDLANTFEPGVNDFQRKPVNGEELKTRISSLLQMKESIEKGIEKELEYFYSQISPHFLFNTLNTIIGLSYRDSEKTRKALINLSIYVREKLDIYKRKSLIPLDTELDLVQAYLEIEEMRYGDKLKVEYDIEEGIAGMIPPLTLQPIVENSVRHGIRPKSDGGMLKLSVKKGSDNLITITIEDDGVGMTVEKQNQLRNGNNNRIGFMNVRKKIKMLKGGEIKLDSIPGVGTRIKIIIPEAKHNESDFD